MALQPSRIERPRNDMDFEDWCVTIFKRALSCPSLKKYGRRGQHQGGVDLIGNNNKKQRVAVQCKLRNDGRLLQDEIDEVVNLVRKHHSDVHHLTIVTTAARDALNQKHVLNLDLAQQKLDGFSIEIWHWEDIEDFLNKQTDLRNDLCGGIQGSDVQVVMHKLDILIGHASHLSSTPLELEISPITATDEDIDRAFAFVSQGAPDETIARLKIIKEEAWNKIDDRLKFRLLANLGNAFYAKDDLDTASSFYLDARKLWHSSTAKCLEARAYFHLGDHQTTLSIVDDLLSEEPNHVQANAIRLQAVPDSYEDVLAKVPKGLEKQGELATALCYKAMDANNLDAAANHARDAIKAEPTWAVPPLNLGTILLLQIKGQLSVGLDGQPILPEGSSECLSKAAILFTRAIDSPNTMGPSSLGLAHFNRSTVLRFQGQLEEARLDLDRAVRLLPEDRQVVAGYAAALEIEGNKHEALRQWRRAAALAGDSIGPEIMCALALNRQDDPGLVSESVTLLEGAILRAEIATLEERFEFVRLLSLFRQHAEPDLYSVDKLPFEDLSRLLPDASQAILKAWWYVELGDVARAIATADKMDRSTFTELSYPELYVLAQVYSRSNAPKQSMECLRSIAHNSVLDEATAAYLNAADRAGCHDEFLRWSESLRQAGVKNRGLTLREAQIRAHYEDRDMASQLLHDWLQDHPEDLDAWLMLGHIAINDNDEGLLKEVVGHVPAPEDVPKELIDNAVHILIRCRTYSRDELLKFTFRLWRRHRQESSSWKALSYASFEYRQQQSRITTWPDVVSPGTTAVLRVEHDREPLFVSVEAGPAPDARWHEFAPDHVRAVAVLGKCVGDAVRIPCSMMEKNATLETIIPTTLFGADQCLSEWERFFPDLPFVQRFHIPPPSQRKAPEDIIAAFQPVTDLNAAKQEGIQRAFDAYRMHGLSTWALSHMLNEPQLRAVELALEVSESSIRCLSDSNGIGVQKKVLRASRRCVLDITSLVIMCKLGILDKVSEAVQLIVPQRLLDELGVYLNLTDSVLPLVGISVDDQGKLTLMADAPEATNARREQWKNAHRLLVQKTAIVSGISLASFDVVRRNQLEDECVGPLSARAIAIAKEENAILITDDIIVSMCADEEGNVKRVCTAAILEYLRDTKAIEEAAYHEAIARMVGWRVEGIPISVGAIVCALELSKWDTAEYPATAAISVFGNPTCDMIAVARHVLNTTCAIWAIRPPGVDLAAVLLEILQHLDKRPDGRAIAGGISQCLDGAFGLDVIAAAEVASIFSAWLSTRQEVSGPGGLIVPWSP